MINFFKKLFSVLFFLLTAFVMTIFIVWFILDIGLIHTRNHEVMALIVVAILSHVAVFRLFFPRKPDPTQNVPIEIATAKNELSEFKVRYEDDIRIINGRADKIFETVSGTYIIADFKSRANGKVSSSDVDEISITAFILRSQGKSVASYGYIFFPNGKWAHVVLRSNEYILRLIERREQLLLGDEPVLAEEYKCRFCQYALICN